MLARTLIDTAELPGGGSLRLIRRGEEYSIMLGANELMNSRLSGSEEALAELALKRLRTSAPRILIGGLGMGFTLRAALACVGPQAQLVVAELVAAVVEWACGPMKAVFGDSLDDPRVEVRKGDVVDEIAGARAVYDAILLDVDNGPDAISQPRNRHLYDLAGLGSIRRALRPHGVFALWSSGPDAGFTRRLRQAAATVEEVEVRARATGRGARHHIWLAQWKG